MLHEHDPLGCDLVKAADVEDSFFVVLIFLDRSAFNDTAAGRVKSGQFRFIEAYI